MVGIGIDQESIQTDSYSLAVAELTDDHGRMQLYLVGWVTWVLAMALLALVAWATAHWLPYIIATTVPNLVIFLFIRYAIK